MKAAKPRFAVAGSRRSIPPGSGADGGGGAPPGGGGAPAGGGGAVREDVTRAEATGVCAETPVPWLPPCETCTVAAGVATCTAAGGLGGGDGGGVAGGGGGVAGGGLGNVGTGTDTVTVGTVTPGRPSPANAAAAEKPAMLALPTASMTATCRFPPMPGFCPQMGARQTMRG